MATASAKTRVAAKRTTAAPTGQLVRTANGRFVLSHSLADPEAQKALAAFRLRVTASPEASKTFLKGVGILNKSGKLSRKFGG